MEPEMMDEDSSVARIDELGNQVHNLSCFQDDEDLSEKLDAVAMTLWEMATVRTKVARERDTLIEVLSGIIQSRSGLANVA